MLSGFQVLYLYRRRTADGEFAGMPVAETLINAAAGHKILSFMDGNAGYN
jgi:hypothetical protein